MYASFIVIACQLPALTVYRKAVFVAQNLPIEDL